MLQKFSARTNHTKCGCSSCHLGSHQTLGASLQLCFGNHRCLETVLMDSLVSICFPRIVHSSSFEKFIFLFLIMSPDALTTFAISISSSALCIGYSSSRTTSKSGLSATFCKTFMLVKKQGIIQRCYLFRNFKCLFCIQLNIYRPSIVHQLLLLCCHSHSTSKVIFFGFS